MYKMKAEFKNKNIRMTIRITTYNYVHEHVNSN